FVRVRANGARRAVRTRKRAAVKPDELEGLDRLRLAVFGDLEIRLLQIGDVRAVLVGDDDVDANEVDARPEDGLVGRLLLWRLLLLLRLLLRVPGRRAHQHCKDDDYRDDRNPGEGSECAPHFPILDGFRGAAAVTNGCERPCVSSGRGANIRDVTQPALSNL